MKYEMNIKDIRNEALQRGLLQGEQIGLDKGIIIGMLQAGATYDAIAKATNASYDTIEQLAQEYHINS